MDGQNGPDHAQGSTLGQLNGLRVVEFTHMVMGPSVGVILADLGADVVKIEPPGGDSNCGSTRSVASQRISPNSSPREVRAITRSPRFMD